MQPPQLIKVSDSLIINPAHVAFAEKVAGVLVLHLALASPEKDGRNPPMPSHIRLMLSKEEEAAWHESLSRMGL